MVNTKICEQLIGVRKKIFGKIYVEQECSNCCLVHLNILRIHSAMELVEMSFFKWPWSTLRTQYINSLGHCSVFFSWTTEPNNALLLAEENPELHYKVGKPFLATSCPPLSLICVCRVTSWYWLGSFTFHAATMLASQPSRACRSESSASRGTPACSSSEAEWVWGRRRNADLWACKKGTKGEGKVQRHWN